jgi:hypothetical protein
MVLLTVRYSGPQRPPKGSPAVVTETGEIRSEQGVRYAAEKAKYGKNIKGAVAGDLAKGLTGGGGCHWELGADPSTAKCEVTNPTNPAYKGFAQLKGIPVYVNHEPRRWQCLRLRKHR